MGCYPCAWNTMLSAAKELPSIYSILNEGKFGGYMIAFLLSSPATRSFHYLYGARPRRSYFIRRNGHPGRVSQHPGPPENKHERAQMTSRCWPMCLAENIIKKNRHYRRQYIYFYKYVMIVLTTRPGPTEREGLMSDNRALFKRAAITSNERPAASATPRPPQRVGTTTS